MIRCSENGLYKEARITHSVCIPLNNDNNDPRHSFTRNLYSFFPHFSYIMSSPLPVNAKGLSDRNGGSGLDDENNNANYLSSSFDRASSTARLSSSPIPPHVYSSSPTRSTSGSIYGSTGIPHNNALERVASTAASSIGGGSSSNNGELPETQVAKAVKRHLVDTATSSPAGSIHHYDSPGSVGDYDTDDDADAVTSVHQLPGGSITHGIYKWAEDVENNQLQRKRTRSMMVPSAEHEDPSLAHLRAPGGFRRHFVAQRAAKKGKTPSPWITRSFVEFLALYGHFGGEDLSDDEGEEDEDEEEEQEGGDEESPLLPREAQAPQGTATPTKAVFLLLKSFIGTGK